MKIASSLEIEQFGEIIESEAFTIKSTGKAFEVLSSKLYKDKIRAIVRELSCNAYDSHVAAGCPNRPFDVHLPSALDPHFTIRDYGTGIDHGNVTKVFSTFFESTKEDSNDFIGALGLGSKSPFAYVDVFTVTAYCGRERRVYACYKKRGVPHVQLVSTVTSNEECGLEITVPVKSEDCERFIRAAEATYFWFETRPNISGASITLDDHVDLSRGWGHCNGHFTALMGQVAYPISRDIINVQYSDLSNIVVKFEIGDLDIQAGREELSYEPQTIEKITNRLRAIIQEIDDEYADILKDCRNLYEAEITYTDKTQHSNLGKMRPPHFRGRLLSYRVVTDFLRPYAAHASHSSSRRRSRRGNNTFQRFTSLDDHANSNNHERVPDSQFADKFVLFTSVRDDSKDWARLHLWQKQNPDKHGYFIRPLNLQKFQDDMKAEGFEVALSSDITLPSKKAKLRFAYTVAPRQCSESEVELNGEAFCYILTRSLNWVDFRDQSKEIYHDHTSFLYGLKDHIAREYRDKVVYFPMSRKKELPEHWVSYFDLLKEKYESLITDAKFVEKLGKASAFTEFSSKRDQSWLHGVRRHTKGITHFDTFFTIHDDFSEANRETRLWMLFEQYLGTTRSAPRDLNRDWDDLADRYPLVFTLTRPKNIQPTRGEEDIVRAELARYITLKDSFGDKL